MKALKDMKLRRAVVMFAGAVFAGAMALPAMAQEMQTVPPPPTQARGGEGRGAAQARMQELVTKLGLTPDQQKVFRETMMDERTRMKALRDDTTVEPKAKRQQMMTIREDGDAKRRAVLTADQKPKYDAWVAENREKMRERRGDGGGTGAGGEEAPPPPPAE